MAAQKTIAVIVVAAGTGERMGGTVPKQYRRIAGSPVLQRTIDTFLREPRVLIIQAVINPDHTQFYEELTFLKPNSNLQPPVLGQKSRQGSVLAGLRALAGLHPDQVLIHDAARPFVDSAIIDGVLAALESSDGALPVMPVTDTIKRSADGRHIASTEDRRELFAAQTPQGFRFAPILDAHERAAAARLEFTDDAALAAWAGLSMVMTPGAASNFKLTIPEDFELVEQMLQAPRETRTGSGFDVHPFEPGTFVTLGGVDIPHSQRLQGHSDADAALHALCDAIYGALGEGDIGVHFPPSDPTWKGAPSTIFLKHAVGIVHARLGRIVNLDMTIVCEAPRISPHVAAMKGVIAEICGITESRIAIKATTSEKLGFTGRDEGLVAMATATIELPRED